MCIREYFLLVRVLPMLVLLLVLVPVLVHVPVFVLTFVSVIILISGKGSQGELARGRGA